MPKILINDTFKKFLLSQAPQARNRIRKQFEFLEIGSWDGGLRVKKIRGVFSKRSVFEARLDKGSRILFTLGTSDTPVEDNEKNILIYVWGIISHDNISLKSRAIIPQNVPFLNFTPFDELDMQGVFFEELDKEFYTEESISQKISSDSGTQKWYPVLDPEWQRIQLFKQDDFELFLYLSPEQEDIVQGAVPPVLISGTAGSGKTTIGVYYLLKPSLGRLRKLFVTYNKFLKSAAERLYNGILNSDISAPKLLPPEFFTYKELCLKITTEAGRHFNPDLEVDYDKFSSMLSSSGRNTQARFDISLIWEEIRSIIKGALPQLNVKLFETAHHKIKTGQMGGALLAALQGQFNIFASLESAKTIEHITQRFMRMDIPTLVRSLNNPSEINFDRLHAVIESIIELFAKQREFSRKKYLSILEYEIMGKKKAPNFIFDRREIYRIFEWYQDRLDSMHMWDELDLARETIKALNEKDDPQYLYDLAVCDEVQDLTDVQQELLFYLTKNPMNLVLTGDTKQIINPSGFRWEELKRHFYSRSLKVPEIRSLSLNFRSSGSIVELSNCLADIKNRLLGATSGEMKEDWKYKSRPPLVVTGIKETELIKNLMLTSAGKTILVRSQDEKSRLKELLGTEMIFTIYEAKGLEFDTVLLWKFCSDKAEGDLWENMLEDEHVSFHSAQIRHEINLLYVAVTRAQKDLMIYDGPGPSAIWRNEQLSGMVFISNDVNYINNIWNVISTPGEWLSQGNYFFEREYYKAAIECYKNADAKTELEKAVAYYNEKTGAFLDAARYFEKAGIYERAAHNFEKCGAFPDALRLWTHLKNKGKISEFRLRALEMEGRYSELAEIYMKGKNYQKAADYYVKARDFLNAAQVLSLKLKDYGKAAEYFEASGEFLKAARLFAKAKNFQKAAQLYEKAPDYENALKYWKKINNEPKVLSILNQTDNYPELINYYEKKKDSRQASGYLKKTASPEELSSQAAELFERKKYFAAYVRYMAAENNVGLANTSFQLRKYSEAAKYYEALKDFQMAGIAFEKAGSYEKAFLSFLKSEEDKKDDYRKARNAALFLPRERAAEMGKSFFYDGEYELALGNCLVLNDYLNAGICYLEMKQYDKSVEVWRYCVVDNYLERVAGFCLTEGKPELLARTVLTSDIRRYSERYRHPYLDHTSSSVVKAVERYFEQNPGCEKEMADWALRLMLMDTGYNYVEKVIEYFEKSRQYNTYFNTMRGGEYGVDFKYIDAIRKQLKKSHAEKDKTGENLAVALYILESEKFPQALEPLEYDENSALLFLFAKSSAEKKEKAFQHLINNFKNQELVRSYLLEAGDYLLLARYYEQAGDKQYAAHYYGVAKEYGKSVRLWIETGQYHKAGDVCYSIGDYENALVFYKKDGRAKMKLADTLLKLNRFDEAIDIYRRQGKVKLIQKALALKLRKEPGLGL